MTRKNIEFSKLQVGDIFIRNGEQFVKIVKSRSKNFPEIKFNAQCIQSLEQLVLNGAYFIEVSDKSRVTLPD